MSDDNAPPNSRPVAGVATDEQLALRAAAGCVASFEQLVERFQTPLLQFLRRRARTAEDAEDLVQEAFVRAYQKLDRYDPQWKFSTWIFTIAHRLNLNDLRRRRPLAENEAFAALSADAPEPGEQLAARELHGRLWQAASEALSEMQYHALWLFYVEELAVKEIAHVLGRSRVAVKTTLFRARKRLEPILADQYGQPADAAERTAPRAAPIRVRS